MDSNSIKFWPSEHQ